MPFNTEGRGSTLFDELWQPLRILVFSSFFTVELGCLFAFRRLDAIPPLE